MQQPQLAVSNVGISEPRIDNKIKAIIRAQMIPARAQIIRWNTLVQTTNQKHLICIFEVFSSEPSNQEKLIHLEISIKQQ